MAKKVVHAESVSRKDRDSANREWDRIPAPKRKMRVYFDADIPSAVAERVRQRLGWDVLSVQEQPELRNRDDAFHYRNAKKLRRIFFTLDEDFLSDRKHPLHMSPGVFVLKAQQSNPDDIFWAVYAASLSVEDAYRRIPDFVSNVKVRLSVAGHRIRFITKDSKVIELVVPLFGSRKSRNKR